MLFSHFVKLCIEFLIFSHLTWQTEKRWLMLLNAMIYWCIVTWVLSRQFFVLKNFANSVVVLPLSDRCDTHRFSKRKKTHSYFCCFNLFQSVEKVSSNSQKWKNNTSSVGSKSETSPKSSVANPPISHFDYYEKCGNSLS